MRSWLSVFCADAKSKKGDDIPIAPSLYSLSNKMDNSLLVVRGINHKYIVVGGFKVNTGLEYYKDFIDGLVLSQNGEEFPFDEFESMHYDFVCRCEGDEWPI
mgnify:CR=1 FL=1